MTFRWKIRAFGFLHVTITGADIAAIMRARGASAIEVQTVLVILDAIQHRVGGK